MHRSDSIARRTVLAGCCGALALGLLALGCAKEERRFREPGGAHLSPVISQSELHPGTEPPLVASRSPVEGNVHALGEGQRLYRWFNCNGCHFNGGGGIGPPLMDEAWIYGSEPANIFASILEGRPDGMPAFRGRITDRQAWSIVEYVRSLGGLPGTGKPPDRKHLPQRSPADDSSATEDASNTSSP